MSFRISSFALACLFLGLTLSDAFGQLAGKSGDANLSIAANGQTNAIVAVSPDAKEWEARAAADLVQYIGQMSGAKPALANTTDAVAAALAGQAPVIVVGQAALAADPTLAASLAKVAKPNPLLRADAIAIKRAGNRVYVAGTNDDSHYYAAAELLSQWGCRWYLPTEFGECIPQHPALSVGTLDYAYAPPFEIRRYWLSWHGDYTGKPEFTHRNFGNELFVPNGHALAAYTKDLIPPGKSMFNVPIADDSTAQHVAKIALPAYAEGKDQSLGMEDGIYSSESPRDKELIGLQYDKYFLTPSYTDAFMELYNKVADILMRESPNSKARLGFLAYANITLPPKRDITAASPLVAYLAPIDFDPTHGMDSPISAPRREYKDILYKWAKVMQGRLTIYDYDQGMLVWRDIPNPSHQAFRQDVKHYRTAGILGVDTESRGNMATTFLNLYLRNQLMWNPDADVDAMIAEFYTKFYGPAAKPMAAYWNAIFKAWDESLVTEHEYFVAPAIYTPELVEQLRKSLTEAEAIVQSVSADQKLLHERMKFTRLSFEVIDAYTAMVNAAAGEADYAKAAAAGEKGIAAREQLMNMNKTFVSGLSFESGYAWWPGEIQQYKELQPFVDGSKGHLIAKLPLVWNFRRDPTDLGAKENWQAQKPDLTAWSALKQPVSVEDRQKNAGNWEQLRTDLYAQAQGVVTEDFQSYTGYGWYQTDVDLSAEQTQGNIHLKFPGLFNECWLYVNGQEVAHRPFQGVWWMNDYRFEWDVDLAGKLKPGVNSVVLRINNPHHFGGIFRRPFLYRAN